LEEAANQARLAEEAIAEGSIAARRLEYADFRQLIGQRWPSL